MKTQDTLQPRLAGHAAGLLARTCVSMSGVADSAALNQYAEQLAALTDSDLLLLYEATEAGTELDLVAHWGLPDDVTPRFARLGADQTTGVGGLRAVLSDASPMSYHPRTQELEDLGIRALWAYPLWADGVLTGQIFFGSRTWDRFHEDTVAIFAAMTLQIAQVLARRSSDADQASRDVGASASAARGAAVKRQQFIAILAHELRNPIAPIRTGIDLIATGLLDDEALRSTTEMMQRQVGHLVRLIDDLLDTTRLDTGTLQIRREPALLRRVIRSAVESIRPALESKSQALKLNDDRADVVVDVDPVRLSQAFVNILSANVQQTPEGGVIAVSVALEAANLRITFEDEDPAVTAFDSANVFELFPKSPMQKSDDGLGIGLALVKGLVELNDGTVEVHGREPGVGAVYTVVLPVASLDPATLVHSDTGSASEWASHRLLIVDDNRDAADTLGLLLEFDGHTIHLAHDGPSAVAAAAEFQPEVILMDIGLPGFSGHEATRRIRALGGPVRPTIIALTGWGSPADREATAAAGCDLHLVKPVAHDRLRETIKQLMATSGDRSN